jgi:hypothetical protein
VLDCRFEAASGDDTPAGNRAATMCRVDAASLAVRTLAAGPHANPLTLSGARESRAPARRVRPWRKALVASLGLFLVCTRAATAQTETARIFGSVVDATDAVVPNARVTVQSSANGFERTTRTNNRGVYTVTNLQPGSYRVSVEADGFALVTRIVELPVGGQIGLDVALSVGPTSTTIVVAPRGASAPNTETATLGEWITSKEVVELPTITRNPYDLALTVGNVSESDPSVSAGTPRGVGVAIKRAAGALHQRHARWRE